MTNLDLITEVNYQLRKHGSRTHSFVTSFYNMGTAYPFDFTNREEVLQIPLEAPVSVSFDFGAVYEGYCYDYGRSVFFGEPDEEYRRVHALVMASQAAGIAALRAGNTCAAADAAARQVIVDGGYGPAFRHRLGHGIGMDVHEPPFLTASDATVLAEGMCFTVEPSIFMPHHLGCRVEDVVVVRAGGGEALTSGFQIAARRCMIGHRPASAQERGSTMTTVHTLESIARLPMAGDNTAIAIRRLEAGELVRLDGQAGAALAHGAGGPPLRRAADRVRRAASLLAPALRRGDAAHRAGRVCVQRTHAQVAAQPQRGGRAAGRGQLRRSRHRLRHRPGDLPAGATHCSASSRRPPFSAFAAARRVAAARATSSCCSAPARRRAALCGRWKHG